jgi:hypothetical protein
MNDLIRELYALIISQKGVLEDDDIDVMYALSKHSAVQKVLQDSMKKKV